MSTFDNWTPGEIPNDYAARVEADLQTIIQKVILRSFSGSELKTCNSTQANTSNKEKNPLLQNLTEEEFQKLFCEEDVDDSEELFNNVIKKAEECTKCETEMMEKNPFLATMNLSMVPKKRTRKPKSKVMDYSLKIMKKFKENLIEPMEISDPSQTHQKTISTLSTINSLKTIPNPMEKEIFPTKETEIKIYPKWQRTETYTPIFPRDSNPNWDNKNLTTMPSRINTPTSKHLSLSSRMNSKPDFTNKNLITVPNRMYTPGHICNWIDTIKPDSNSTIHTLPENIRSAATINSSKSNTEKITKLNEKIPIEIENESIISNSPKHNILDRFKSSPPYKINFNEHQNNFIQDSSKFNTNSNTLNESGPITSSTLNENGKVRFNLSPPVAFMQPGNAESISSFSSSDFLGEADNNPKLDNFTQNKVSDNANFQHYSKEVKLYSKQINTIQTYHKYSEKYNFTDEKNYPKNESTPNENSLQFQQFLIGFKNNFNKNYNFKLKYSMKFEKSERN